LLAVPLIAVSPFSRSEPVLSLASQIPRLHAPLALVLPMQTFDEQVRHIRDIVHEAWQQP
jgi:hypothetical protein